MDKSNTEKLVIIGSGPAGLTAAIYAARGSLEPLVIEGETPGGQPTLTSEIEDYSGFPEGISGPELSARIKAQAARFGARYLSGNVSVVNFKTSPFEVKVGEQTLLASSIIIASGASPKWLGLPSEKKFIGRGVSICAVCDGGFFRGKDVAVIGGGDSAMREAYYLSKMVNSVTIIHRRDIFRAQAALQNLVKTAPNIKIILNSTVEEVLGEEKVTGLKIKNTQNREISQINIDGMFVAIGHQPNSEFLKGQIDLDERGYVKAHDDTKTSVEGVFVAGDVADWKYRQSITAAGAGAKAALDAEEYIDNLKTQMSNVKT